MTGDLGSKQALPEKPASLPDEPLQCPACGTFNAARAPICVHCGAELPATVKLYDTPGTIPVRRLPQKIAVERESHADFSSQGAVLLQFLPSATCFTLDIQDTVILGRTTTATSERVLDLTGLNALAHGVSRRHCALQRRGERLMVTDLGSVNGTFLNDLKLMPHAAQVISHGDRLILGTLHLVVFFDTLDAADGPNSRRD